MTFRVRTGITDGVQTEISGRNVTEGMKVIDGIVSTAPTSRPPSNPLGPPQQGGGRRGPGGGGPF